MFYFNVEPRHPANSSIVFVLQIEEQTLKNVLFIPQNIKKLFKVCLKTQKMIFFPNFWKAKSQLFATKTTFGEKSNIAMAFYGKFRTK